MRRKYFIRGMGVGIIITAIVFTIAWFFNDNTMSSGEIIEKAKELGMVMPENSTLENKETKDSENKAAEKKENNSKVETTTDSTGAKVTVENLEGDEVTKAPQETTDPTTENNKTKQKKNTSNTEITTVTPTESAKDIVSFSIRAGENSSIIAANLYKAGLVENPTEFDKFLESNGYDKYLKTGSFSIRKGSTQENIAKTLTGR